VTRSASPSLVVARARPTERMALLRGEDVLDGDPDPRPAGVAAEHVRRHRFAARFGRWNCGTSPRRASSATFAAER
jgi:hypothetical protein